MDGYKINIAKDFYKIKNMNYTTIFAMSECFTCRTSNSVKLCAITFVQKYEDFDVTILNISSWNLEMIKLTNEAKLNKKTLCKLYAYK